jgi:phage tail sheath protein FI
MAFNIGLNVVEVDGSGAPAIAGAATSVAGFSITTRRGIPNRPARVTSFQQFVTQFGSYLPGSAGAYMVKGFFDNGGQTAYINRVVSTDAASGHTPSSLTLQAGATNVLTLETGYRGARDPGAWGGELSVRVQPTAGVTSRFRETGRASVQGAAIAATVDMSAAPELALVVDGQPLTITFTPADFANPAAATRNELRDALNRKAAGRFEASLSADRVVLTSRGAGTTRANPFSSIQVTPAYAPLGLAANAQPVRGTVAARTTTTLSLNDPAGFAPGDAITLTEGADSARVKILTLNPATGAVTFAPAVANIANFDPFDTVIAPAAFDLIVATGSGDSTVTLETWTGLTMESDLPGYAPTRLNDSISGSRYLVATDARARPLPAAGPPPDELPAFRAFNPGREGVPSLTDYVGDPAAKTGFHAFDPVDVQLLTTESTDRDLALAALDYCASRGDAMFVGAVPEGFVAAGQAVSYGQRLQGAKRYGALYGPWIKVFDPLSRAATPARFVPPSGHVMGVYARIETTRGIWKAPAGDEAQLRGALDIEHQLSDADHTDMVKNGGVNGIRAVPGAGIVVDSSRTLSTDTRWTYVNVRLLFNFVKSSLRIGLRWVRQEPNRDTLWSIVKHNSISPFLMGLWRQGAFGTGKPEEVFTVICDASNNPPDQVDLGIFKVEVYFYPSKPAETIVIVVGQQPGGGSASEA